MTMRLLTIILFLFLPTLTSFGQTKLDSARCIIQFDTLTKREVYSSNDRIPKVEGGQEKLYKEFRKLRTADFERAIQNDLSGKIIIAFIVEANGRLTGKRVLKNISGTDLGDQMLELVDNLKWVPEKCKGQVVPTLQILPVLIHSRY